MQRSVIQHNTPANFDAAKYLVVRDRMHRRRQLWHSARLAFPDYAGFRANVHIVEAAIAAQLEREFPTI